MIHPTVLVVQNSPTSGPGRLLDWFAAAGLDVHVVQAHAGEPLPPLAGIDGVVLLGGGLLPDEDDRAPWLAAERALTAAAVRADVPLLGICLGGQLLAHCTGGTVTGRSGQTERGSCPVELTAAAATDDLFAAVASDVTLQMIQNHEDSVTALPPGAVLLARSDVCEIQAFRVGVRAWGLQFHPEADSARLARWDEAALTAQGLDRAALVAAADAVAEVNERQSRALALSFARVIHEHATTHHPEPVEGHPQPPEPVEGPEPVDKPTPVIAYRVARADGRVLAERHPDLELYAASTVKLAVLVAVARALQDGTARLEEPPISRDTFPSQVPGAPDYRLTPDDVDPGMAPPGAPMTLAALAERMIVVSSNEATNLLLERFGLDAVARVIAAAGADGVRMGRAFGDRAAAERDGVVNVVTASGLATLMGALVSGRLADPRWTGWMVDLLSAQQDPLLAAEAPAGVRWGSKSGEVDGIRHDVAFIGDPGPDALVIAVCTRGLDRAEAEEAIRALGRLAFGLAH